MCFGAAWFCEAVFPPNERPDPDATALADEIDRIVVKRAADASGLKTLEQSYKKLSFKQKRQVTSQRYDRLTEAISLAEQMEARQISLVVKDKSKNGFDIIFSGGGADLNAYGGKTAFEGQADVSGNGAKETFDRLFDGKHGFTIEAELNPNSGEDFNMIASKGDNCAALRISEHSVYFFIKEKTGDWKGARVPLSADQMSSWLHVAGVYRKGYVSSYLKGSGMATEKAGAFSPSEFPLGIGYCPELNRTSVASIRKLHVYAKPLTEDELETGQYGPDSDFVELWYDFDEFCYEGIDTPVEGIRCYADSVTLMEQEERYLPAEPVPYYASGTLRYQSNNPDVAAVSPDGTVSGVGTGTAVITASIAGTDFTADIPVTVQSAESPEPLSDEQRYAVLVWIGVLLYLAELFVIVLLQRKRLIRYLARLSDEISLIGTKREETELPDILEAAGNAIRHVEETFRQNDFVAREAEQRKNDLVVYLAHDLKTPIASLIGYLTLLRDEKQISPELHRHYLEIALNNSERLDELINEFFEITRFNVSQITLDCESINLTLLMEQLVWEFKPMLAEKGLTCRLEIPRDVTVNCDADKIERVFDNLLRNAIHYSFRDTEIRIMVTAETDVTAVFLNHGEHIPASQLSRIFEQFYRLDQARSTSTGGSGLGLAIAKQIIELHQGTIRAECTGEEIRFTVTIPFT